MDLYVRLRVIDHWTPWVPADADTRRVLGPAERHDLRQGDVISLHGGYLQVTARPETPTENPEPQTLNSLP